MLNHPLSAIGNRLPSQRIVYLICAAIALGIATVGLAAAIQFWRVLPYFDQWEMVQFYRNWSQGTSTICDLVAPHNEHRILLTRLLFLVDFTQFRGDTAFVYGALVVLQLGLALAIGLVIARESARV